MANPNIIQNEWQYGVCECYQNLGICCKGYFCGPCLICDNGEAVGKDGCGWCMITCCFPWVSASLFRTAAREKYGIEGEEWQDWAMGVCCTPFVSCQTAAEHEERNGAK